MKFPIRVTLSALLLCSLVRAQEDNPALVDAGPLGLIQGSNPESYEENGIQKRYIQFRGIPYANVTRRFMPSELFEEDLNGPDTFDARPVGLYCYQPFNPEMFLSEECLLINVYSPAKYTGDDSTLKPVIFYIHGGAFTVGYGAFFGGGRLLARDVVVVTFNYRLGLLGFFSLENEDVPGNAGMYDILNALKWTNKYIKYFGGDPNRVTIAGQSAGSVAVTALMSSPMAQGLFHGAIGASGSSLNAWGTSTSPLQDSLNVANYSGCHDLTDPSPPNLATIAECMRNANATTLVEALMAYQRAERNVGRLGFNVVAPVVQSYLPDTSVVPKFLPRHPAKVFEDHQESNVPLLMSCTKHDGSYVLGVLYNRFIVDNNLQNDTEFMRYDLIPTILNSLDIPDKPSGIHDSIAQMYMGDSRLSGDFTEMYPGLIDILSVFFFKGDTYNTAIHHSKVNSSYWMSFDYKGKTSFWGQLFPAPDSPPPFPGGITHTDDMIYLFPLTFLVFDEEEAAVNSKMMDIWVNFATTGAPATEEEWPALNDDTEFYLSMDGPDPTRRSVYRNSFAGPGYEVVPTPRPTDLPEETPEPTTPIPPNPALVDAGPLGLIQGSNPDAYEENGVRRPYIQFRGIPYANVTRRFMPSELFEEDLDGPETYDGRQVREYCYQPFNPEMFLSEECLLINVYSPAKYTGDDSTLKPVIFYIHGGAFTVGYGAFFGGGRLLARDVVLVTFNYRLGLLGFFSLENEDVPGNAGMYDILNALKWTNKYIKYFGGDPSRITIAGQSAGSVAVTALMSSPMAQGLFQGAIGASGSSLNAWATSTSPLQDSLNVASHAGCHNLSDPNPPDLSAIAECMRSTDAMTLVDALMTYQKAERNEGRLGFSVVSPVVQSFNTSIEKFLPKHPREVFENNEESAVPLLMSCAKHDGSYVLGVLYNRYIVDNSLQNDTEFMRHKLIPTIMDSLGIPDVPSGIHDSIAQMYMGDSRLTGDFMEMYPGLIDIVSVFFFKGDTYTTALHHSKVNSSYWMSFDYKGKSSFWGQLFPAPDVPPPFPGGITHTDDMIYLFPLTFLPFDEEEAAVNSKMMDIWVNFATTGAPAPEIEWPALNATTEFYLSMDGPIPTRKTVYRNSFAGPGYEVVPTPRPTDSPDDETSEITMPSTSMSTETSEVPTTPGSGTVHMASFVALGLSLLNLLWSSH